MLKMTGQAHPLCQLEIVAHPGIRFPYLRDAPLPWRASVLSPSFAPNHDQQPLEAAERASRMRYIGGPSADRGLRRPSDGHRANHSSCQVGDDSKAHLDIAGLA